MAASIQANVRTAYADLGVRIGTALAAAAATFVAEHQRRLNISNPRPYLTPSRPGEYPRKRTGFGQANVYYQPTSPTEISRLGHVDAGYGENAFYMQHLHDAHGRKGIEDTLHDMRQQLQAVIDKVATSGGKGNG